MNKLFTKIAKLTLGLAMAAGVGVAIGAGRKDASPAQAADQLAYTCPLVLNAKVTLAALPDFPIFKAFEVPDL